MSRKNIWRGLTTLTASLLTVSVAAGPVVDSYRTDIDKFLGTKSSAMVQTVQMRICTHISLTTLALQNFWILLRISENV